LRINTTKDYLILTAHDAGETK